MGSWLLGDCFGRCGHDLFWGPMKSSKIGLARQTGYSVTRPSKRWWLIYLLAKAQAVPQIHLGKIDFYLTKNSGCCANRSEGGISQCPNRSVDWVLQVEINAGCDVRSEEFSAWSQQSQFLIPVWSYLFLYALSEVRASAAAQEQLTIE